MDTVNSEDKRYWKPLYENSLTITVTFRLEMTEVMESVPKKSLQTQKCTGRQRGH